MAEDIPDEKPVKKRLVIIKSSLASGEDSKEFIVNEVFYAPKENMLCFIDDKKACFIMREMISAYSVEELVEEKPRGKRK